MQCCRGVLAKIISLVLLITLPQFLSGCTYYHLAESRVTEPPAEKPADKASWHPSEREKPPGEPSWFEPGKKIVLHQQDKVFVLSTYSLAGETLKGVVDSIGVPHEPETSTRNSYVAQEIHVYLSGAAPLTVAVGQEVAVPLAQVEKIMVYHVSAGKTAASWGGTVVGVIVGVAVIAIALLVWALSSKGTSCPFVYASSSAGERFEGEIYSGALYPELERHDYLSLPTIEPVDNAYQIRVTNEAWEVQHTNLLELFVVDHPADLQVLFDRGGQPHTIRAPRAPVSAVSSLGEPALERVLEKDGKNYGGVPRADKGALRESLVLTFQKPEGVREGKLVVRARNSLWLDYSYLQYLSSLGPERESWQAEQRRGGPEGFARWAAAQGTKMAVSVEGSGGWRDAGIFPVVGPMGFRDLVLPVTFEAGSSGPARVKLECGLGFWEVDYAAMDFATDLPVKVARIEAKSAVDSSGRNVLRLLNADDERYLDQPRLGDAVTVRFPVPAGPAGGKRSVVLHAKGHYEILPPPEGAENPAVGRLKKSASFLEFSRDLRGELFRGVGAF